MTAILGHGAVDPAPSSPRRKVRNGVPANDLARSACEDGKIDCVVLDPPYMHSPGGTAHTGHKPFEAHCRNNGTGLVANTMKRCWGPLPRRRIGSVARPAGTGRPHR